MTSLLFVVLNIILTLHLCAGQTPPVDKNKRLICYYDAQSYLRPGFAEMKINFLKTAAEFCTHLIYGYAELNDDLYEISSLNVDLDMFHYKDITSLKTEFPHLRIYLSIGGDHDNGHYDGRKYMRFLESGKDKQNTFIESAVHLLKRNDFDGLDLAFKLPTNKPRKVHSEFGLLWKKFKKLFTGDFIVDPDAALHKDQYTEFVGNLARTFRNANLSLTMTVLPNVNSTWYFDVTEIYNNFEYINLFAFDFLTPSRNPEEADYTAPIFLKDEENRLAHYNIDYQVNYWVSHGCPAHKLNLGIATYGRAWKLSSKSGISCKPVVHETLGPAEPGLQSNISGLLSWPEICSKLAKADGAGYKGADAPVRKVQDLENLYGNYAFRPADDNDEHGIWISFDDPDFAGIKTNFAKTKFMGGVALYDLAYDDFRGLCTGVKFPILRSVRGHL
ncbi:chitinase-like protein Idgf1 [Glossina fuscipes]|uniref:Chitinase-like protein Idgf1 n=1 Tax=Glossina fuscipes TaxID=7396 RepID=A0A8U0WC92_9MUSC|nr:chitinase-like protein Idgf1 [Glossina fuscipes]KAI9586412.1 hypothetical protein GQX74_002259 [Glossina fuscipes]